MVAVPARSAPLALLLEAQPPDLKLPRTPYKVLPDRLPEPLAPQFLGFPPLF